MYGILSLRLFSDFYSGQKFAVMEEKVLLSGVLRKFTITCTDPDDIRRSGLIIMRPSKGINITLARRDKYD